MSNGIQTKEQAAEFLRDLIARGETVSAEDADAVETWNREAERRVAHLFPGSLESASFNAISFHPRHDPRYPTAGKTPADRRDARADGMATALKQLRHLHTQDVELFWKEPAKPKPVRPPALETVIRICERFPLVVAQLGDRRAGRELVEIADEYDVHYVLGGLLATECDDIRREEPGPSVAGSSTRVEFLLTRERILVECKMTRKGLADKELGKELTLDIRHYEERLECDALVIFIYDPSQKIRNRAGLIAALEATATKTNMTIRVIIRP